MKQPLVSSRIVTGFLILIIATTVGVIAQTPVHRSTAAPYRFSGPYTHENLTIYLIRGRDVMKRKEVLTLSEALTQKKVIVRETGNVNQLVVENISADTVFIHAGDIVKGGKQDRTFPEDCFLPAHSGKIMVPAFCVEQGRWHQRGAEGAAVFGGTAAQLSSKKLKLAARREGEQAKVWEAVRETQEELSRALTVAVSAEASPTSLQLSLENKALKKETQPYLKKLLSLGDGSDVIGYAFAINGEVNSADVYASNALFRKLWPTLLESSAIEAISKRARNITGAIPRSDAVKDLLADWNEAKTLRTQTRGNTEVITSETGKRVKFETRDRKESDAWIHRSYVTK